MNRDELTGIVLFDPEFLRDPEVLGAVPVLQAMAECQHENRYHHEGSVLDHTLKVVTHVPMKLPLRLAALFHDCGKPETKEIVGVKTQYEGHSRVEERGHATYHKHERVGESIARRTLLEMSFSTSFVEGICLLVRNHMYPLSYINQGPHSDRSVRRLIRKFDSHSFVNPMDLMDLNRADILSHTEDVVQRSLPGHNALREHIERLITRGDGTPP